MASCGWAHKYLRDSRICSCFISNTLIGHCDDYRAAEIAFWVAVLAACCIVLHTLLVLAFRCFHRHPPAILEFPRLELFMLLFMVSVLQGASVRYCRCIRLGGPAGCDDA